MEEQPGSQPPKTQPPGVAVNSTGAIVGGIIAGVVIGGTVLWIVTGVLFALALTPFPSASANTSLPFIFNYVLAVAIGLSAFFLRKRSGFLMGMLIGASIGMLGSSALCNAVVTGFSNGTH